MQIDPGAAGLRQTPCAICSLDIREVYQLRSLTANLHTFSIYLRVFLFLDCLLVVPLHAPQYRSHQVETSFENHKMEKLKHLIKVACCALMQNFRSSYSM